MLETWHSVLDDLWKLEDWVYPQKRMVHLMDVTAHVVTRFIQNKTQDIDLWMSPYQELEETLQQVLFTRGLFSKSKRCSINISGVFSHHFHAKSLNITNIVTDTDKVIILESLVTTGLD